MCVLLHAIQHPREMRKNTAETDVHIWILLVTQICLNV